MSSVNNAVFPTSYALSISHFHPLLEYDIYTIIHGVIKQYFLSKNSLSQCDSYSCRPTDMPITGNPLFVDLDECTTGTPCMNGGTCNNIDGSFTCTCAAGWTGSVCETGMLLIKFPGNANDGVLYYQNPYDYLLIFFTSNFN